MQSSRRVDDLPMVADSSRLLAVLTLLQHLCPTSNMHRRDEQLAVTRLQLTKGKTRAPAQVK